MEVNTGSSLSKKTALLNLKTAAEAAKPAAEDVNHPPAFVNHAALSWHESRRKWIGDHSRKPQRTSITDPIISWSTTYEELLSTNEPFAEPISLREMVDFLVDIWQDEGLFD